MKLKKLISVMLIGACVCSMAACGSKKKKKRKLKVQMILRMQRLVFRQVQQAISTVLMISVMIM